METLRELLVPSDYKCQNELDSFPLLPMRLDKYLFLHSDDLSRSYIQKLIKDGGVFVNEKSVKSNYKVVPGDRIVFHIPEPEILKIEPEKIPLDILYEDSEVILINKSKGMVVHPSAGHTNDTLVNALLYHCGSQLSGINGVLRPGIVHRIDKDTTGVLVVCKTDRAHGSLARQLKEHSITRRYHAIVYHHFKEDSGTVDAPIGRHPTDRKKMAVNYKNGKHAVTHYQVLSRLDKNFSYIECRLETGRTHQIRVHMASISHPLLGDAVYGPGKSPYPAEGQVLHAKILGFVHPVTGKYMEFEAPLPEYFNGLLKRFGFHDS